MQLYQKDAYAREFDAEVIKVNKGKFVVLSRTLFYPDSGGQPHDTGALIKDGKEYPVVYAGLFSGEISHEISTGGLKEGDGVHGIIDFERRYLFMRYHTACHILSAVIHKMAGAKITGNQIGTDKTRIDFSLVEFDRDKIGEYEAQSNRIIERSIPVNVKIIPREELNEDTIRLAAGLPDSIREVRIIDIEGIDQQPCGGTHVKNTEEIGKIRIIKAENKGKNNRRIYYKLE